MAANASKPNSTKTERRDAAMARAASVRQAQLKQEARTRRITLLAIVVGLLAVGVLVAFIVIKGTEPAKVSAGTAVPAVAAANGGFTFGADGVAGTTNDGAVLVETYVDYICPACGAFEQANADMLDELRTSGDITLAIHPVAILDRYSNDTRYSSRAAAAFAYVAQNDAAHALAFSELLFANQPGENTDGLTDAQLTDFATEAGVPAEVAAGIAGAEYQQWIMEHTDIATSDSALRGPQGFSTPTVAINGTKYDGATTDTESLKAAILAAKG